MGVQAHAWCVLCLTCSGGHTQQVQKMGVWHEVAIGTQLCLEAVGMAQHFSTTSLQLLVT